MVEPQAMYLITNFKLQRCLVQKEQEGHIRDSGGLAGIHVLKAYPKPSMARREFTGVLLEAPCGGLVKRALKPFALSLTPPE